MRLSNCLRVSAHNINCLARSYSTQDVPDAAVFLTGMDVHRQDRKSVAIRNSSHRGPLTAVNNEIQHDRLGIDIQAAKIVALENKSNKMTLFFLAFTITEGTVKKLLLS